MKKDLQKSMLIILGAVGGTAALGAATIAVWNSRPMKTARIVRRAKSLAGSVGTALCRIADNSEG